MRLTSLFSLVLSLSMCVFFVGCGGDSPEGLAKEKTNAMMEFVGAAFGGDKDKAKAAEAKVKAIDDRIGKLSADDKKKFEAAMEKLGKELLKDKK